MVFHLYFAGAQAMVSEELMEELKSFRLLSYFHDKKRIERRRDMGLKTFIDSGAFTAHTKGIEVDLDEYISYLNERDETVGVAAELDEIPGEFGKPKTKEQLNKAPLKSWANYLYMIERCKSPEKVLPIFHQGENLKHLVTMLESTPLENGVAHVPYIGISPSNEVSVKSKTSFLEACFEVVEASSNPNVKIHAFGMTSLKLLERFKFHSADSTSWLMTSANGGIMTKFGTIYVSDRGLKDKNHISNLTKETQREMREYVEGYGFDLDQLSESYKQRSNFNLTYLTEWAKNYQYKPQTVKQFKLF